MQCKTPCLADMNLPPHHREGHCDPAAAAFCVYTDRSLLKLVSNLAYMVIDPRIDFAAPPRPNGAARSGTLAVFAVFP